ncbi:DUF1642 domain-containing protein [Lacticaseibacillus paracasei]|uniref:DUF1642 domain-containing protein n=1 Tax=Lacticaseibacillus paracasei TaxID=1597 RepID=UPI00272FB2F0|nr:DUF1642 domain-containing protein [Lacticaseibacillus paracasei]MDP0529096.1 DUF1642 domain-containing protein [Lacticaseibacillus paracasei]
MSEEKMYAVKNDEGKYWDFEDQDGFWELNTMNLAAIAGEEVAECVARDRGGHVVTFVEEPEKVVISPEEAKLVKNCLWTNLQEAFLNNISLLFRGRSPEDVTRLKSALTNGYTVAKDKKYNVKVPHTKEVWYYKSGDADLLTICPADKKLRGKFTESEIEHYGLQNCECVEAKE